MSRLYDHLAEISETEDGGFEMTRKGRRFFSRFLRQHGQELAGIKTHAALIDILGECNAEDFVHVRQQMDLTDTDSSSAVCMAKNESVHRLVA